MHDAFGRKKSSQVRELSAPPYLWRFGLREPADRFNESIVVPIYVESPLRRLFANVQLLLGVKFTPVPVETAHITLADVDNAEIAWNPGLFYGGAADVLSSDVTDHSIRFIPEQRPFIDIATAFGLPKPAEPYGLTVAYAGARLSPEDVAVAIGDVDRVLREAQPLQIHFEFVERQRRPLASREPFRSLRLNDARGPVRS